MGKTGNGADAACGDLLCKRKLRAVVDACLIYLVAPCLARSNPLHQLFCTENAAGYLEPGKALPMVTMAHSVHARGKIARPDALLDKLAHTIQQLGHALVLEGRSVKAREEGAPAHQSAKRRQRERSLAQIFFERPLIKRGGVLLRGAFRQKLLGIQAALTQTTLQLGSNRLAPGVLQIHLVDEDERRDVVAVEQTPQRLGVSLDAIVGTNDQNRIIERLECSFRFGRKIDMPRSVDEHEARITMLDHYLRREDGDAALALDCIGIQVRVAVIDASAGADLSRVEEHCLGKRGLTCIHVRQDADNCLLHAFPLAIQMPLRPCCRDGRASKPTLSARGCRHVHRPR